MKSKIQMNSKILILILILLVTLLVFGFINSCFKNIEGNKTYKQPSGVKDSAETSVKRKSKENDGNIGSSQDRLLGSEIAQEDDF
jgi:hypothetical protein